MTSTSIIQAGIRGTQGIKPCGRLRTLLLMAALAFAVSPRVAQARRLQRLRPAAERGAPRRHRLNRAMNRRNRRPGFFKRLRELPPAEQEQAMASDPKFQSLPSARQQQIRQRLARWNAMTPEQQQRFREREEIFEGLSAEQRRQAREVFREWRQLPPERRAALNQAFLRLRDLPPEKRDLFLNNPEIQQRFSPHEREVLNGLGRLLPQSGTGPAEDAEP